MNSDCTCAVLRKAARRISAVYDEALNPAGINVAQFSLLRTIRRTGPVSLTELGRLVELERSTVGRNVKVLGKLGLVETGPGSDSRETVLTLSPAGEAALAAAMPHWERAQAQIETILGRDGVGQLLTLLNALPNTEAAA